MPPKVTPKTIDSQKRVVYALELRAQGLTYQQIADTPYEDGPNGTMYGGDRHNCRRDIVNAYEQTIKEPADMVRQLEIQRLDMMLMGLASKGLFDGDTKAVTAGLALMARRAKLLGLDAPTQIETSGDGTIIVEFPAALTPRGGMAEPELDVDLPDA